MGVLSWARQRIGGAPPRTRRLYISVPSGLGLSADLTYASLRYDGYYVIRQTEFDVRLARQFTQTDGYGRELVEIFVDSVVGRAGIQVQWGDDYVQERWNEWRWNATKPFERIDEAQRDVVRGLVRDGESLFQILGDMESMYLHMLDPIDLPMGTGGPFLRNNPRNKKVQGITFDDMGRPTQYDFAPSYGQDPPQKLPASEVVHAYYEIFPGQVRGISWMRPAIIPLRQLSEFEHNFATMVDTAAKLPGYFTVPENLQAPLFEDDLAATGEDEDGDGIEDDEEALARRWLEQAMNADPTTRPRLPEGTQWHSVDISSAVNGQLYTDTRKGLLGRIARGLGLSYNSLAGDLGEANYSSLRLGQMENNAQYRRVQRLLIAWLERVAKEWKEWQAVRDPIIEGLAPSLKPQFDAPSFDMIDPLKEAATAKQLVENRVRSRQEIIREGGGDPDKTLEEIVDEEAKLLELRRDRGLSDDGKSMRDDSDGDDEEESGAGDDPRRLVG